MAKAAALIPGFEYRIESGVFEDEIVTIVSNETFPDDHPNRRKVTVLLPSGDEYHILPRLLSDAPVSKHVRTITRRTVTEAPVAEADVPVVETAALTLPPAISDSDPITHPMDWRLDHLRPSPSKVRRYIRRRMDETDENSITDVDFLLTFTTDAYRAENDGRPANIMLKGDTQSGKTFLVEVLAVEWAKRLNEAPETKGQYPKPMPIFTLSGSSGVTDYDLFGQTTSFTDADGQRLVWLPGVVDLAARVGGILYLDEVNAMGERVTSSLHPLCDHRHAFTNRNKAVLQDGQFQPEVVVGSLDLWPVATYNEGYRGVGEMNEAFVNRFRHLPWGYNDEVEGKLIKSPTVRLLAERLRTARAASKLRTPVGTAALQRLERDVKSFGISLALWTFTGMFRAQERDIVATIIEDASIEVLLIEELRQAEANESA
jgi:MoxR-like ATPase